MTELNDRQRKFIGAVLSRKTAGNRPVLEAVLKAYAVNEGLAGPTKGRAGASRTPLHEEEQENPDMIRAIKFEPDCWDSDLAGFNRDCQTVQRYVSGYGRDEFDSIKGSDRFRSAEETGKEMDRLRQNPMARDDARRNNMQECLQRFYSGDDRVLIEGIMTDFDESETVAVELPPVFESREDNAAAFRDAMAGIANFTRRHGYYPWGKFLGENRMLLSGK